MKRKTKVPFDPKVFLSKVRRRRTISDYRKGQIVYRQGDPADAVFYIQAARPRRPLSPSRARKPWSPLGGRRFFRRRMLDRAGAASVDSLRDDGMRDHANSKGGRSSRVIHEEPAFAELFIAHLLARNSRVEEDLVDQLFNSSEKRLARTASATGEFWQGRSSRSRSSPRSARKHSRR